MCGRYTLHTHADQLAKRFNIAGQIGELHENYNVAPGQYMPIIVHAEGTMQLYMMRWGLIPRWAKDPAIGYRMINARADTIFEKPVWRGVISRQRCLVPADGFYEWKQQNSDGKVPYYIRPTTQELFAFAGVWETWQDDIGNELMTYSIITTEPNKEMSTVHNRMPVILHQEDEASWLEPSRTSRKDIEPFLLPYEDNGLEMFEVSRDVNVTRNNEAKLIYPINSQ